MSGQGAGEVSEPTSAEGWNALGNERYRRGDAAGAEEAYRKAIEVDPGLFKPYGNLGNVLAGKGKRRDAVALFEKALELNPKSHRFRTNLGNALRDLGRTDEAIATYQASIAVQPSHAALHNLAIVLAETCDLEAALPIFERALELNKTAYETLLELGLCLDRAGETARAVACLERACDVAHATEPLKVDVERPVATDGPAHIDALLLSIAEKSGNITPALAVVDRRCSRRDLYGARDLSKRLTFVTPQDSRVWLLYALILMRDVGDDAAASEVLIEGLQASGTDELALAVAECVTAARGEPSKALTEARAVLNRGDLSVNALRMVLLLAHKCEDITAAELLEMHRDWARRLPAPKPLVGSRSEAKIRKAKVRVGYLSADFRRHSVARFIEPLLRAHDRERFEVVCYSAARRTDSVTDRLRTLDVLWRDVAALNDREIAGLVAGDGIDVLVDLGGHTAGSRLTVLSHRPSPVQLSFLGYPGTTGLPEADFRISDANVEPPGDSDRWSTERILRVASAWCFEPPEDAPPATRSPKGYPTFASFNALAKLGPRTVDAWARILREVPSARLRLKNAHLATASVRAQICRQFERAQVDPSRLELMGFMPSGTDHLAAYCDVDLALDTFPYHGTTTTCEALWMGVPVVTLGGERHASRVGVSLLRSVGLDECVTESWDEYVEVAVRLVRDTERLARMRNELRERIVRSPLGDRSKYASSIEAALLEALRSVSVPCPDRG